MHINVSDKQYQISFKTQLIITGELFLMGKVKVYTMY